MFTREGARRFARAMSLLKTSSKEVKN